MKRRGRRYAYRPACQQCHLRKVKCDFATAQPCSGCRSTDVACVARERRRRNYGPPRSQHQACLASASQVSRFSATLQHHVEAANIETPTLFEDEPDPDFSEDTPESLHDADEINQAAATLSSLHDTADAGARRHLVEMLSQDDIDVRIIQKGVRIVYPGQEYSNINYLIRHRARNAAVHHFPANQISRKYTSHDLDKIPRDAFTLPSPAVVDELLERYFTLINPLCPILDGRIFMGQYRGRDPQNSPSLLVLQAVLMVGAHVSSNRSDRDELKAGFFRRAKMLFDARFEWNRDVVVQAALLLTWSSEGVEDVGANSYYWVGVASRTALGLGMHRDASASTLNSNDKRLWKHLWWILVAFDVLVTLSYGRPQVINLDDSDVPPLAHSDFQHVSNVNVDLVVHCASICTIISKALRERFGLRVPASRKKAALLQADRDLANWMTRLPTHICSEIDPHFVQSALLHINYYNFLILLHRPEPKLATLTNSVNSDDIEICSSAASNIVNLFQTISRKNELQYLNVFAVNALFTTMIQLGAEIRVPNPVLSSNAIRKFDIALEILRSLSRYWFNAEIILRLFEDSSARLKQQLPIGKSIPIHLPVDDSGVIFQESIDQSSWHNILAQTAMSSAYPSSQLGNHSTDHLGWNYAYWENTGFPYLPPFDEVGLTNYT